MMPIFDTTTTRLSAQLVPELQKYTWWQSADNRLALAEAITTHETTLLNYLAQPRPAVTIHSIYSSTAEQQAVYPLLAAWSQLKGLTLLRYGLALYCAEPAQLTRLHADILAANTKHYAAVFSKMDNISQDLLTEQDMQDLTQQDIHAILRLHRVWPESSLRACLESYSLNEAFTAISDAFLTSAAQDRDPLHRSLDLPFSVVAPVLCERAAYCFGTATDIDALIRTTSFFCTPALADTVQQCHAFLLEDADYRSLRSNEAIAMLLEMVALPAEKPGNLTTLLLDV